MQLVGKRKGGDKSRAWGSSERVEVTFYRDFALERERKGADRFEPPLPRFMTHPSQSSLLSFQSIAILTRQLSILTSQRGKRECTDRDSNAMKSFDEFPSFYVDVNPKIFAISFNLASIDESECRLVDFNRVRVENRRTDLLPTSFDSSISRESLPTRIVSRCTESTRLKTTNLCDELLFVRLNLEHLVFDSILCDDLKNSNTGKNRSKLRQLIYLVAERDILTFESDRYDSLDL